MKNIILGVLLEMPDPQRDNFVLNSNDYSLIKPFVENLTQKKRQGVSPLPCN